MLLDVLERLSADTGLHIEQKREELLSLLQTSADELYPKLECTKIYREMTLVVTPDAVVSLPSKVGELRGMRMHTNELPFDLHSIGQPRYVSTTLQYKFKNWRDLGDSAVQRLPVEIGPLTLTTPGVETVPVSIAINGQSSSSLEAEETIVMDAVSKTTATLFTQQISSISCSSPRKFDIQILDDSANVVAILFNNQRKTRYKIVDVSQIFWTLDTSAGESLIDVLYKLPKVRFSRDSDAFYAGDDFDETWYNMAMYFYLKPLPNRLQDAVAFQTLALQSCISAKDSAESGILKKVSYGRNKFYNIFKKFRYYPGSVTNVDHNTQS
jgi:hypothetical protein